ncbi:MULTISPECIES: D-alanine--D-alanine ligase [unclassified Psychrobacter]|uniref:D-alanine--D-alanine ligase n=1 Tax=unclassified Psychrobacter TaxID=196806 RepID=UPI0025FCA112|nr:MULTISPECIES: D-alanine--D-alanine ligase [unclassified Psychrobacter]
MTTNNQEHNNQENNHQKNESNPTKGMNAEANTAITNPEPALAAAAQAEQNKIAGNQPNHKTVPSIANSAVKDASQFGKVAVIYGGSSNERSVSLDSGAAVLQALQNQGVDATHFDPKYQDITELRTYDRVFNVLHGRGGEDGLLQGVLQWFNIPQTGSGILASALGMDKVRTKQLWQGCGLSTAPFSLLTADTDWQQVVNMLGLPLIIKPVHEGSSIGMTKVNNLDELPAAYATAVQCGDAVMAERWITGREFTIVIIDDEAYPVIRLEPADITNFYDFEAKYNRNDTSYYIPCGLSTADEKHLQELSLAAFRAVDAKGWGRIDAMQDEAGNFWLLEINTVPGMTSHSLVPMAAKARGMDFDTLCWHILAQTL